MFSCWLTKVNINDVNARNMRMVLTDVKMQYLRSGLHERVPDDAQYFNYADRQPASYRS